MSPSDQSRTIKIKIENRGGVKKYFVKPGKRHAKKNETVTWEMKDSGAVFFFPDERLFGETEYRVPKDETLSLTVNDNDNIEEGEYPYAVFTDNNEFVEGGSYPKIIIDE